MRGTWICADCDWNGAMTSVSAPFFVPIFMGSKIGNDTEIWKGVDIRNCLVETKNTHERSAIT